MTTHEISPFTHTFTRNTVTTTSTGWGYYDGQISVPNFVTAEDVEEMLKRLAPPEYTELRCRECGGEIEQRWNNHIVKCPYCKTVYAVGRKMLNG